MFRFASISSVVCLLALHAVAAPRLSVDANSSKHPISPYVYGINNWSDNGLQKMMRIPLVRWGGDDATSFNWQNNVKNNTGDNPWLYENYSVSPGFDAYHETNLMTGAASLGTIPLMDWLPKAAGLCSFSVKKYGLQQSTNPDNKDCGNGVLADGKTQVQNDPNDAYVPADTGTAQDWVRHIMKTYGPANSGGVQFWSMDNEPEWWYGNHRDVYNKPATYDDVLARNIKWAAAVKAVDPSALTTGPVPGGWSGMYFSFTDMQSGWGTAPFQYWDNPIDQKAHGGVPWIPYYLQQMKAAEAQYGHRLLDVVDVHGYIMPGCFSYGTPCANPETLRMTSTRALWDPNYKVPGGGYQDASGTELAPQLVPRLRQWVNDNYPGTMTAITEYNWGAQNTITGAIAQADILGIFGREGLDLGTAWGTPNPTDPAAFSFKIFLNYDDQGSQFGETSISANSDDADTLSIFAAQRSDTALTILVLNKTNGDATDNVSLANFTPAGTAQVWQYSSADLTKIARKPDVTISGNAVATTFPALSMTLLVVPASQSMMSTPKPAIAWVKNAASWDASAVSPGEIVAIQGTSVGPNQLVLDPAGSKVPTSLSGVRVLFNGLPAPMVYSAPINDSTQQLSAIVPYEVAGSSNVNVQVEVQGNRSDAFPIAVTAAVPGLFTNDFSGTGQAAVLNVDGSVVTRNGVAANTTPMATRPATRGSYIEIFATGEGQTTPPGVNGRLAMGPYPKPVQKCSVKIGGLDATVTYCGAAPNFTAGALQVNAQVPAGVTPGNSVPIQLSIGSVTSAAGVTIAVQ